jgi:sugar lactone lactonase YvrE
VDRRRFVLAAAGVPLSIVLGPRASASPFAPVALVTADLESHVVVFDLDGEATVGRIRTGPGPRSIESVHDRVAVIAHTEHGVVTLVDAVTRIVRAELDGFEEPRYTAVHPRWAIAYVTDSARQQVVTLDVDRARVLSRTPVPGPARHVSISPDGRALWTALGTKAERLAVLDSSDPVRPRLMRTFSPPFLAHDVVFAPDNRAVWVTSGAEPRAALFGRDRRLRRLIGAGAPPQHVTFGRDKVFVAAGYDGTVRRHRPDGELVREVKVPVGSYNVTFGWGSVVSPSLDRGTLSVLDRNGGVRAVARVARAAHDACIVIGP